MVTNTPFGMLKSPSLQGLLGHLDIPITGGNKRSDSLTHICRNFREEIICLVSAGFPSETIKGNINIITFLIQILFVSGV